MKKTFLKIAMVAGSISGSAVFAQEGDLFSRLDANSDGVLTAEEAGEDKKTIFERLLRNGDKDKDGKLTKEEFAAGLKDAAPREAAPDGFGGNPAGRFAGINPEEIWKRLDRNGDGKIEKEEAPERMRENFDRVDANGDGVIDKQEFQRVAQMMMQGRPGGERPANPDGKRPETAPPTAAPRPEMMQFDFPPFARIFDKDGNGELSADEVSDAAEALKKLDRNNDGKLVGAELMGGLGDGPRPDFRRPDNAPRPESRRPDGSRPESARPEGNRPEGRPNFPNPREIVERLKQADKDGDNKISKEEAPERLRERFDRVDANQDGFIDADEVRKMVEMMREQIGGGQRRPERPDGERPTDRPAEEKKE